MPSAQAQNQPEPLLVTSIGAGGEAGLVGDLALLGIEDVAGGRGGIDPHRAMAGGEQRPVLVVAVGGGAGRAVVRSCS